MLSSSTLQLKSHQRQVKYLVLIILGITLITNLSTASAHKIEISADIGGILHIEPDDNPRAGEPSQAWFALTRKGGKALQLTECNCQLAVYAEPHTPGEPALLEPPLQPLAVEKYQGIPSAKINFPRPGAYQLELTGKPATGESFQPFVLKFAVTVASGNTVAAPQSVENAAQGTQGYTTSLLQPLMILGVLLLSVGIVLLFVQGVRRGRD
jgi:hypothetical protein